MQQYLDCIHFVLANGIKSEDRTGVGTISTFGYQMRFDLRTSFPAVTTKKLAFKSMVSELLWFLEGSRDERRLAEILHGSRSGGKTIWTQNAEAPYWLPKAQFKGDLGRVYGVQWRTWMASNGQMVDQVANLIKGIKEDPYGRRHILTAWNPGELDQMALPPCHLLAQFYVREGKLSCMMIQRSADIFLGVPFNIASYALLTMMIAHVTGLQAYEFVHVLGDAHLYTNHIQEAHQQLLREPKPAPQIWLNPNVKSINDFTMNDVVLQNYDHHPAISAPMAV